MKKNHPKKLISAYLDNQTTAQEGKIIESHLQKCLSCQELYQRLKTIRTECLELPNFRSSQYFAPRTLSKLLDREGATFWTSFDFLPRPIINGAVIISIIIILILALPQKHQPVINDEVLITSDYLQIIDASQKDDVLTTDEEALEFALGDRFESFEER